MAKQLVTRRREIFLVYLWVVVAKKYFAKGWTIVAADPLDYLRVRFFKMWYVWQKENVFFYQEPDFASHKLYTYLGNLLLLVAAGLGLVVGRRQSAANRVGKWIMATTAGSVVYATLAFSLTHAEYRLTIPFYPLLFLVAPLGIIYFFRRLRYLTGI